MKQALPRSTHQSLERGLRILETAAAAGGAASLAETVRRTAPHRSTAHHLLQTLVSFGYLRQDAQTRAITTASAASPRRSSPTRAMRLLPCASSAPSSG